MPTLKFPRGSKDRSAAAKENSEKTTPAVNDTAENTRTPRRFAFEFLPAEVPDGIRNKFFGAIALAFACVVAGIVFAIVLRSVRLLFLLPVGLGIVVYQYVVSVLPFALHSAKSISGIIYTLAEPQGNRLTKAARQKLTRPYLYVKDGKTGLSYKVGLNSEKEAYQSGSPVVVYYDERELVDIGDSILLINNAIYIEVQEIWVQ